MVNMEAAGVPPLPHARLVDTFLLAQAGEHRLRQKVAERFQSGQLRSNGFALEVRSCAHAAAAAGFCPPSHAFLPCPHTQHLNASNMHFHPRLQNLRDFYRIAGPQTHRALDDVELNEKVLLHLRREIGAAGAPPANNQFGHCWLAGWQFHVMLSSQQSMLFLSEALLTKSAHKLCLVP